MQTAPKFQKTKMTKQQTTRKMKISTNTMKLSMTMQKCQQKKKMMTTKMRTMIAILKLTIPVCQKTKNPLATPKTLNTMIVLRKSRILRNQPNKSLKS